MARVSHENDGRYLPGDCVFYKSARRVQTTPVWASAEGIVHDLAALPSLSAPCMRHIARRVAAMTAPSPSSPGYLEKRTYLRVSVHDDDRIRAPGRKRARLSHYRRDPGLHARCVLIAGCCWVVYGLRGGPWEGLEDEVRQNVGRAEARRRRRFSGTEDVYQRAFAFISRSWSWWPPPRGKLCRREETPAE